MSVGSFFDENARRRVKAAVQGIEAKTAAEVVVAVRARSWHYRHTHYLVGFVAALAVLAVLLFHPQSFDVDFWPLELTIAFVAGAALCMLVPPLERLLTARSIMTDQVARAARAAFVDLGVTRTRDRSGLLVYVSLGERAAEIIADIGLENAQSEKAYAGARNAIEAATKRADFDAFIAGLEQLGQPLATALPRRADDENELPDEVD